MLRTLVPGACCSYQVRCCSTGRNMCKNGMGIGRVRMGTGMRHHECMDACARKVVVRAYARQTRDHASHDKSYHTVVAALRVFASMSSICQKDRRYRCCLPPSIAISYDMHTRTLDVDQQETAEETASPPGTSGNESIWHGNNTAKIKIKASYGGATPRLARVVRQHSYA